MSAGDIMGRISPERIDRDHVILITKVAVIVFCGWYLSRQISLGDLLLAISSLGVATFGVVSVVVALQNVSSSLVLHKLGKAYGDVKFRTIFTIDAMAYIANSFIPSRAGALLVFPALTDRYTPISKVEGLNVKALHFGLLGAATGVFALVAGVMFHTSLPPELLLPLGVAIGAYFFVASGVAAARILPTSSLLNRYLPKKLAPPSEGIRRVPAVLLGQAAVFVLISDILLLGVRFGLIASEMGVSFPLTWYMLIPVLAYSISILPISIGGIGVTEATATAILISLGIDPETATVVVLLDRMLGSYIPLGIVYVYVSVVLPRVQKT